MDPPEHEVQVELAFRLVPGMPTIDDDGENAVVARHERHAVKPVAELFEQRVL